MDRKLEAFARLLEIMDELRQKCPWDSVQTMESLRHLTIEETYELSDSILQNDLPGIKKELGDLMLHLVFYARIASETGDFDIADVLDNISEKLIVRHPHIYGDVKVENASQVKSNWERIKLQEGHRSVLAGVPTALPALVKAYRIQEKARGVGFDWIDPEDVWKKIEEELGELHEEVLEGKGIDRIEDEFGDLLFSLVNYSRFININPEDALERSNIKFIKRFRYLEEQAERNGRSLKDMTLEEMDAYWNEAKKLQK
jgi:XTP/dITP diphosphohydrolase